MPTLHVWDPFLAKDIKAIEDVQKCALKACTSHGALLNYNELLDYCDIPTMASRRKMAKLCLLFNILFYKVKYPTKPELANSACPNRYRNPMHAALKTLLKN